MSEKEEPRLSRAVSEYRERKDGLSRARRLAGRVALVGSLGWLVVVPALLGTWGGVALDRRFHTGVLWTAAGVMAGASFGFWLLWQTLRGHGDAS